MSDQGTQYSAYIEAQLQAELARRESVNSRSTTAITSSAGLVTLALAVFAVMIGKDFVLGGWAKGFLAAALLALLGSASFAVAAGFPWKIKLTSPATLRQMIGSTGRIPR
jgi:hypothetical protein